MIALTCTTYRAWQLPEGGIRLEIGEPTRPLRKPLGISDVADCLGKDAVQVDKLSRRSSHPLPIERDGCRPFITRLALNRWLLGLADVQVASSVFGV
jgi:hypothetical protein